MVEIDFSKAFEPDELINLYHERIAKSRSVGKDGVRHSLFQDNLENECALISKKVLGNTYEFTTYREKLIIRGAHKAPRQLSVPTVRDRLTLRTICNVLRATFERANTPPPHAVIKDCGSAIAKARDHSSFLRMDVKDFYPSIRHDMLRAVFDAQALPEWLSSTIIKAISTPTGAHSNRVAIGVPQGLSISNALAAIYMGGFDLAMTGDFFYRRYVDDIIVIAPSEKVTTIYKTACAALGDYGLQSHPLTTPGKTEQLLLGEGVKYLGYVLKPTCISIRDSSYAKMFNNLYRVFTQIKYAGRLDKKAIFRLNLKITGCFVNGTRRGWLMYFAQTQDIKQLKRLDRFATNRIIKLGFSNDLHAVKAFTKSYYEIRFNVKKTNYIPNFDDYSDEQRIELVSLFTGVSVEELNTRTAEFIEFEFSRIISKEVSELEKDVFEPMS